MVGTEDVVEVISEVVLDSVVVVEVFESVVELSSVLVVNSSPSSVDVDSASFDDVVADAVMGGTSVTAALVELVLAEVVFVDFFSSSFPKRLLAAPFRSLRMSRRSY